MHPIYQYPKSREAFERATKVIPSGIYGHQGPAEGCYVPVEAFPLFSSRAQGAYLWDLDGNRFIDYMCAYGPNILGYHDPDVDAAAAKQRAEVPFPRSLTIAHRMTNPENFTFSCSIYCLFSFTYCTLYHTMAMYFQINICLVHNQ